MAEKRLTFIFLPQYQNSPQMLDVSETTEKTRSIYLPAVEQLGRVWKVTGQMTLQTWAMSKCWKNEEQIDEQPQGQAIQSQGRRDKGLAVWNKISLLIRQEPPQFQLLCLFPRKASILGMLFPLRGKHSQGHTALCLCLFDQNYDSWPPKAKREAGQTSQSSGITGRRQKRMGKQATNPGAAFVQLLPSSMPQCKGFARLLLS